MVVKISQVREVDVKVLRIHTKVSDCFFANLIDENNNGVYTFDGYVPKFMPGEHYGDYIILDIEIETGKILNWKVPTEISGE